MRRAKKFAALGRAVKRAAAAVAARPCRLPLEVFVACSPKPKGNDRKVLKLGGKITVQHGDKAVAAQRELVGLLAAHPARPAWPLDCPLRVDVEVRVAVPSSWSERKRAAALRGALQPDRRPDRGNFLKLGEDALERAGYVVDDARIVCGDVAKVYAEVPGWRFVIDNPLAMRGERELPDGPV